MKQVTYQAHPNIRCVLIQISRFNEGECGLIPIQISKKANEHLEIEIINIYPVDLIDRVSYFSERRVYIEKEGTVDIIASKLAEMSFIPALGYVKDMDDQFFFFLCVIQRTYQT